ncbi:hypothetical protein QQ045_031875 [Rhodiola kirilowii]
MEAPVILGPSGIEIVDKAQCIFCKKELSANSKSNGTTGLIHHLKICKQNPENCQQTILTYTASESQGVDDNNGSLKNWKFDQEDDDELPFRFLERAGFQYFMRTACPLFSVPSRWTMVRDCYMMYDDERLKLKAILKKSACRVCSTTDTWTSIQRINYLCLTAHFIDDNQSMNKRILNFVPIRSHRAIEHLRKKLVSNDGCLLKGKYLHMRCIAHIINLVVVDGLKSMNHSISRIRNAIRYVRQSPSRWAKFKECISLEKIDNKSHVTLDVRTRLGKCKKIRKLLESFSYSHGKGFWNKVCHFQSFFTEIIGVLYVLEEWQRDKDKDKALATMAARMKQKYDKYWGNAKKMNMIIYIAVVLDPRYKLEYLPWTFSEIYKGTDNHVEAMDLGEMVKIALYEMFNEYMRIYNCVVVGGRKEGTATSMLQFDIDEGIKQVEGSAKIFSMYMMHKSKAHVEENRTELDTYLKEATESINTEFDILGLWRMHSPRFPILSQMARDVLAVPISTVASESAFSTSGRIIDPFWS